MLLKLGWEVKHPYCQVVCGGIQPNQGSLLSPGIWEAACCMSDCECAVAIFRL